MSHAAAASGLLLSLGSGFQSNPVAAAMTGGHVYLRSVFDAFRR
jgi:glutamate synthase domain-containing protein 3